MNGEQPRLFDIEAEACGKARASRPQFPCILYRHASGDDHLSFTGCGMETESWSESAAVLA